MDEEEHKIAANIVEWLDAPIIDKDYVLLKWSPYEQKKTYRTKFRVFPTELLSADVVFGRDWEEEKRTSSKSCESSQSEREKKSGESGKDPKDKRRRSSSKSVCSSSCKSV